MNDPKISIVTPCYNMLAFLQRCIASVKDQQVNLEHIVIDGGSSDGTAEWLKTTSGIQWISEKDKGMYEALNKGLAMSRAEIIGHINADEQYLPYTLAAVVQFFEKHPEVDYITGDFLMIDKEGDLIAYRKAFPTFWPFFFSNYLYTYTCTLFFRRRVVEHLKYDSSFKSIADVDFVYKMIKQGSKGRHLKKFIAAFTYTGNNLSELPSSGMEIVEYEKDNLPKWFNLSKPILRAAFYLARIAYGTFWHKGKIEYELFTSRDLHNRKKYIAENPTYRWIK